MGTPVGSCFFSNFSRFLCSDSPTDWSSTTDNHYEDYCILSTYFGGMVDEPFSSTSQVTCEREVSPALCPLPGWVHYKDYGGHEGSDSCLFTNNVTGTSWTTARSQCPPGSHLLTVKHTSESVGLFAFSRSLHATGNKYLGCHQLSTASTPLVDWVWIDGTPATNLNCGSQGCNLWQGGEPK